MHGMRKIATNPYHPNGNGGVERVNHAMAQVLPMIVNERQDYWNSHLPHVQFSYNHSVSAATELTPNEVHMNHLPHLPLTVFEHPHARGQLEYDGLAADRQRRSYALVREQHALNIAHVERQNSALSDGIKQLPTYAIGGWVWVYNTAATIRQGVRADTNGKVLKAKLSLN